MRLEFKFIDDKYSRPICLCNINGYKLRCLFDTGAGINVVCLNSLINLFGKDCKYLKEAHLGGFGGKGQLKPVYTFNKFDIGMSKGNFINYNKLLSFLDNRPNFGCDIILSTSMFTECKLTIDYLSRRVYIDSLKTSYTFDVLDGMPYVCSST